MRRFWAFKVGAGGGNTQKKGADAGAKGGDLRGNRLETLPYEHPYDHPKGMDHGLLCWTALRSPICHAAA